MMSGNLNIKVIYAVILIALSFFIFFAISKMNTAGNNNMPETSQNPTGSFIPPINAGEVKDLAGKIRKITDNKNNDVSHLLEDENGKIIVYLTSDDIDLSLSEGLNVYVTGTFKRSKDLDFKVVNVKELKFK